MWLFSDGSDVVIIQMLSDLDPSLIYSSASQLTNHSTLPHMIQREADNLLLSAYFSLFCF